MGAQTIHTLAIRQESKGSPVKNNTIAQEDLILHGVKITHPDRIVFEEGTITKGQVARYYAAVAPFLLRDISSRPISLLRCPSGIQADCFYQRNVGFGLGADVYPFVWEYKGRSYKYIYVKDEKGIMEMIQMGVIEIHPWGATIDKVHTPDRMIFDLDPDVLIARRIHAVTDLPTSYEAFSSALPFATATERYGKCRRSARRA